MLPHCRENGPGIRHKLLLISQFSTKWVLRFLLREGLTTKLIDDRDIANMVRRRPGFEPKSAHVGFFVGKVAEFLRIVPFPVLILKQRPRYQTDCLTPTQGIN
jgi:hypothetical protein